MKRQFIFGTMLTAALTFGVSAQTPQSGGQSGPSQGGQSQGSTGDRTQGSQSQERRQDQAQRQVTLIGCVQAGGTHMAGGASPGGAGSTASSQGADAGFMLTNVSPGGTMAGGASPQTGSTGAAGTSGAAGSATAGAGMAGAGAGSYRLTGGQNLKQYVGQRVEVSGTLVTEAGGSGAARTGSTAGGSTAGAGGSAAAGGSGSATGAGSAAGAGSATGAGGSAIGRGAGASGSASVQTLRVTSVKPASGGGSCSQ
jgi:hypothetical protein